MWCKFCNYEVVTRDDRHERIAMKLHMKKCSMSGRTKQTQEIQDLKNIIKNYHTTSMEKKYKKQLTDQVDEAERLEIIRTKTANRELEDLLEERK